MARWKRCRARVEPARPAGQLSLQEARFDEAEELATDGMEAAYRHSTTEYKRAARERLTWLIQHYNTFTSDDIVNHLNRIGVVGNHSALGALIKGASRAGLITATGEFRESNRRERHKQTVRIWKSNIVKERYEK